MPPASPSRTPGCCGQATAARRRAAAAQPSLQYCLAAQPARRRRWQPPAAGLREAADGAGCRQPCCWMQAAAGDAAAGTAASRPVAVAPRSQPCTPLPFAAATTYIRAPLPAARRDRLLYTLVCLAIFLVCSQLPLYGVKTTSGADPLYWARVIMASSRGTVRRALACCMAAAAWLLLHGCCCMVLQRFTAAADRPHAAGTAGRCRLCLRSEGLPSLNGPPLPLRRAGRSWSWALVPR